MRPQRLPKVKKGDPLSARKWNQLVEAVTRNQINLGQSTGINGQITPYGTILHAYSAERYPAVANGNITARSGTTAGLGSVFLVFPAVTYSGGVITAVTLTTTSIAYQVYNPSSNTMTSGHGIDSGQYCWIEQDMSGLWAVSPMECS